MLYKQTTQTTQTATAPQQSLHKKTTHEFRECSEQHGQTLGLGRTEFIHRMGHRDLQSGQAMGLVNAESKPKHN